VTYDVSARANGVPLDRAENPQWQRDAVAYLGSGSATMLARRSMDGLRPETEAAIRAHHVLALRAHGVDLLVATDPAAGGRAGVSP
jgi:hypothetical protein